MVGWFVASGPVVSRLPKKIERSDCDERNSDDCEHQSSGGNTQSKGGDPTPGQCEVLSVHFLTPFRLRIEPASGRYDGQSDGS